MRYNPLNGIRFYLLWAVACALTGWTLSALHWLAPAGYVVMLPLVIIGLVWLTRDPAGTPPARVQRRWGPVMFRRFRRPLPLIYLIVLVLVFVGAVSHAPTNYDGLTYRLPRMLNWLSNRGWNWIYTNNERMNFAGTNWEWMAMPLLILRTDRILFLINAVGFILLPGLIFSVFQQTGVKPRAARSWMWVLSTAFGYAMQAGSIGNDLPGALFCLISVHYGLCARRSGRVQEVWLAGLAAAVMTGVKTSNLPLLLPCLVAAGPALKYLRRRWAAGILVTIIALVISILPTVALNQKNTRDWTGDPDNSTGVRINDPVAGLLGNSLLLGEQLLMPPFLPGVPNVNAWLRQNLLPDSWKYRLQKGFPRYSMGRLNELPQEEGASLGIGVTVLLLAVVFVPRVRAGKNQSTGTRKWKISSIGLAAWVATFFYMVKMGSEASPRLMLPYYLLVIIPILLLPEQDRLVRRSGWRVLAVLVSLSVVPCLTLTPSRPLWPAQTMIQWLVRHNPESHRVQRMQTVYVCYRNRNDLLGPVRAHLPEDVTKVGFVAGENDSDYSLWRPFGRRQVVYLWDGTPQSPVLLPPDVEWIVVRRDFWAKVSPLPLEEWAAQHGIEIVFSVPIQTFASGTEYTWCLLHVRKP
jgi:hypothetical protein